MREFKMLGRRESLDDKGVRIFCSIGTENEEVRRLCSDAAYDLYEKVIQTLYRADPVVQERQRQTLADLKACFDGEAIFVEQIPNEYDARSGFPWLQVTTRVGRIKIGRRHRVISIEWPAGLNPKFPADFKGTVGPTYIHADDYDQAKDFIRRILGTAVV